MRRVRITWPPNGLFLGSHMDPIPADALAPLHARPYLNWTVEKAEALQHHLGVPRPFAEDGLGARPPEVARLAPAGRLAEAFEGRALGNQRRGRLDPLPLRHAPAFRSASRICWSAASTEVRPIRTSTGPAVPSTASTLP